MTSGEYFFLIFLGTIAVVRLLLASREIIKPAIGGFRLRHYMYGIALLAFAFLIDNLTAYAIGWGLMVDEVPLILVKGAGHKDESWRGNEDYYTPWCVAGVLILMLITYLFRDAIAGLM